MEITRMPRIPIHIIVKLQKAEQILEKLQKKERIYKYSVKRGKPGIPLTKEEEKLKTECLKKIMEFYHPRS